MKPKMQARLDWRLWLFLSIAATLLWLWGYPLTEL